MRLIRGWLKKLNSRTETRTYNTRVQLTRQTAVGPGGMAGLDLEYRYSGTANDGKLRQTKDWMTVEEVTYQYDALGRLIAAATTGPEWGMSFGYDGFGDRTSQAVTKGSWGLDSGMMRTGI